MTDMSTIAPSHDAPPGRSARGRWIHHWEPENEAFWERTGKAVARRNPIFSIFAENIAFSVWLLWSTSAALLVAFYGFGFTAVQMLFLVAVPNFVGSALRIPYTFVVPRFGGRNWTVVSGLLLLIPTLLLAAAVRNSATPYWAFMLIAATAGFGGGNFASSMTNISFFYPDRKKGLALGLNAAGAIFGVVLAITTVVATAVAMTANGGSLDLSNSDLWRTIVGGVSVNAALAAFGVSIGALIRNLAAALAGALVWIALVEGLIGELFNGLEPWLPFAGGQALGRMHGAPEISQGAGGLLLAGYTVVFAAIALTTSVRRDIT